MMGIGTYEGARSRLPGMLSRSAIFTIRCLVWLARSQGIGVSTA